MKFIQLPHRNTVSVFYVNFFAVSECDFKVMFAEFVQAVATSTSLTGSHGVDLVGLPCVLILPAAAATTNFQVTAAESGHH